MVHADASTFTEGVSKEEALQQVLDMAHGLFEGQRNWVCNLSNTASLLWHAYKSLSGPSNQVNWAGFYVLDPKSSPQQPSLILGPFQGKVACQTIPFGRGVCGTAASTRRTELVADVDKFPGHIACDSASKSEIVVPILTEVVLPQPGGREQQQQQQQQRGEARAGARVGDKLVAIIDVDCAELDGFDGVDRRFLEELAALLGRSCDW